MDIKRDKYLNDLINRMHNGMIKVVTGIRRCGKSYLLFNIFKNYLLEHGVTASHIITIELDQRKNKKYRDPDTILDYIESLIEDDEQHVVRRISRIVEKNMKCTVRLFSIATSCQKTPDSSKSLCQCHRRHNQIEIFYKFQFCHLTVEPCCKDSSDDSSINHKTVPRIFQKGRIFKNRRKLRNQI